MNDKESSKEDRRQEAGEGQGEEGEVGMRHAKNTELPENQRAILENVKIEAGRHPGYTRHLFVKYDIYRGPKAFVSVEFPNANGVTETGRHVLAGEFYVEAFIRKGGKDETMYEGFQNNVATLGIIAADLLRKMVREEAAKKHS